MKSNDINLKKVIAFHWSVWKQDKELYMIWIFVGYMFLAGAAFLAPIVITKYIIQSISDKALKETMIIIAIFGIISLVLNILQTKIQYFAEARFMASRNRRHKKFTERFSEIKYCHLEDATFHKKRNEARSAISNNISGFQGTLSIVFYQMPELFIIIVLLTILGTFNYFILLIAVGCGFAQYFIGTLIQRYTLSRHAELSEKDRQAQYFYKTAGDFNYGKDIRLYQLAEPFTERFQDKQNNYHKLLKNVQFYKYRLSLFDLIFLIITNGVTYYLVINAYYTGFLSLGDITVTIMSVLAVSIKMQITFKELARLKGEIGKTKIYIQFITSDLYDNQDVEEKMTFPAMTIEFRDVSFHYPNSDELVLKNISFSIKSNSKTALVGVNGSGKSTIVKLISGLYTPTKGQILINGVNMNDFNKDHFRKQIAVVYQDVNLYAASVLENITGDNPCEEEKTKALEALRKAGLYETVMALPKKENHSLLKVIDEEGTNWSGGEAQKLAIARALYKNDAKMLILDEPTSALDAIAEKEIYEKFQYLTKDKTAIIISHRLASTKFCDDIIYLEDGEILERGSHEELIKKEHGKYQKMFLAQGKYYKIGVAKNEI